MFEWNRLNPLNRSVTLLMSILVNTCVCADTIEHYMNIANNIPKMSMKADAKAQAWAKSARNILTLTGETIAESLLLANQLAEKNKHPLFCPPKNYNPSGEDISQLIQQAYKNTSKQLNAKQNISVSEFALVSLQKKYPCAKGPTTSLQNTFEETNKNIKW